MIRTSYFFSFSRLTRELLTLVILAFLVTGVSATGTAGNVAIVGDSSLNASGLQATATLGNITVLLQQNVDVTGVQGTTALGETEETGTAVVNAVGVQATGEVGTVLVWSQIIPGGDPSWSDIAPITQTPNWTDIAA